MMRPSTEAIMWQTSRTRADFSLAATSALRSLGMVLVLVSSHRSWLDAHDGRAHGARPLERLDSTLDPAKLHEPLRVAEVPVVERQVTPGSVVRDVPDLR